MEVDAGIRMQSSTKSFYQHKSQGRPEGPTLDAGPGGKDESGLLLDRDVDAIDTLLLFAGGCQYDKRRILERANSHFS